MPVASPLQLRQSLPPQCLALPAPRCDILQGAAGPCEGPQCLRSRLESGRRHAVAKMRVLLPLGTILTVVDVLLSRELHSVCDSRAVPPPSFWECAVPGEAHSASHLAHSVRLLVEKGLDTASTFAVLQTDIATFYDKVDVIKAAEVAVAGGLRQSVVTATILHQLLSCVSCRLAGADERRLEQRTSGALIGSRTAGALGRFVVHKLASHVCRVRASSALVLQPSPPMLLASYVDNIVVVGGDASNVEATFAECERYLTAAWGLALPAESTSVLVPRGSRVAPAGVACVPGGKLLGHSLDDRASSMACCRRACDAALASAQAQMRACRKSSVPLSVRMRVLESTVLPQILFRVPSWAPSVQCWRRLTDSSDAAFQARWWCRFFRERTGSPTDAAAAAPQGRPCVATRVGHGRCYSVP